MLFTGCCANGKVAARSLAACINLCFLCRNAALEPLECEASDIAGLVEMLVCGCAVICLAPEEVGRGLCQAHWNTEGVRLSSIYVYL